MLFKLIQMIMTQFLGNSLEAQAANAGFITQMTAASLRKFLMLTAGIVSGLVVLFGGAFTVLLDLILSSRDHNQLALSSVSIVGFSLIAVSLLTVAVLFRRHLWQPAVHFEQPVAPAPSAQLAPILELVMGLAQEFMQARQQQAPAPMTATPHPVSPTEFTAPSATGPGPMMPPEPSAPIAHPTYN